MLFWRENLKTGTELALMQAQMLSTTKVETIQAFVAYLVSAQVLRLMSSPHVAHRQLILLTFLAAGSMSR